MSLTFISVESFDQLSTARTLAQAINLYHKLVTVLESSVRHFVLKVQLCLCGVSVYELQAITEYSDTYNIVFNMFYVILCEYTSSIYLKFNYVLLLKNYC